MDSLVDAINEITIKGGRLALGYFGKPISASTKPDGSYVSFVDKEVENVIKDGLDGLLENSSFVGEEGYGMQQIDRKAKSAKNAFSSEYIWAIDPLDGTSNYLDNNWDWAVSVGLLRKVHEGHIPLLGSVFLPKHDMLFYTDGCCSYSVNDVSRQNSRSHVLSYLEFFSQDLPGEGTLSMTKSKAGKYEYRGINKLIVSNCTVCSIMKTVVGSQIGHLTSSSIWDFAAGLAIGNSVGLIAYDALSGQQAKAFVPADFVLDNEKRFWKLKSDYFISSRQAKPYLLDCLSIR